MKGLMRNYIWGVKSERTCAKVKWDIFILHVCKVRTWHGVINPKAQIEALLAKLFICDLSP
jgi:hypothetical protein